MPPKIKYRELNDDEFSKLNKSLLLGSCVSAEKKIFCFNEVIDTFQVNQGVCKLFDELIVNCFDHIRTNKIPLGVVYVNFDPATRKIILINSSVMKVKGKIYGSSENIIPRVLLKKMKTSSNYDSRKDVAGRHGYGLKLCRVFSETFVMKVSDGENAYIYTKNSEGVEEDKVLETSLYNKILDTNKFVKIIFSPDIKELNMKENEVIEPYIKFRLTELYAYYNFINFPIIMQYNNVNLEELIKVPLHEFILPSYLTKKHFKFTYEEVGGKKIHTGDCFFSLEEKAKRVKSNNFCILNGVDVDGKLILNIIFKILKKHIFEIDIEPTSYFNSFSIVRCDGIVFTGQDKLKIDGTINFNFDVEKEFPKKEFLGILSEYKKRKSDNDANAKKKQLKLENFRAASTTKNGILVLVEGLSAKTAFQRAIDKVANRSKYGILAMTGKIFNCIRDPNKAKVNKIILTIAKILKLDFKNNDKMSSEYSEILIVPDPDSDGAHIACLVISLFYEFFPKLLDSIYILDLPRFTCCDLVFFSENAFNKHMKESKKKKHNTIFAKGLGSLPANEFKKITQNMNGFKKKIIIDYEASRLLMNYLFGRESNNRKLLFKNQDLTIKLYDNKTIKKYFREFEELKQDIINHEFIPADNYFANAKITKDHKDSIKLENFIFTKYKEFLDYSNKRTIPELIDGDTIVTRKIKYNLLSHPNRSCRADVLCGSIIQQTLYHHGNASLTKSVNKLASSYYCGINIPFIDIDGSSGSRNGKDTPQHRYITVKLNPVAKALYNNIDFEVEPQKLEEGQNIEPNYLLPILPVILINGGEGIGTGFNCYIPPHNVFEVCDWYENRINDKITPVPKPWVRGFFGKIILQDKSKLKEDELKAELDQSIIEDTSINSISLVDPTDLPSDEFEDEVVFETEEINFEIPEQAPLEGEISRNLSNTKSVERLKITGTLSDNIISEIPFNISITNFITWLDKNEIHYDDSQLETDKPNFQILDADHLEKVVKRLTTYKGIGNNFFDGDYLFTNLYLEKVFELFYWKRLGYYKMRVIILIKKNYAQKIKMITKRLLMEQIMVKPKISEEEQIEMINNLLDELQDLLWKDKIVQDLNDEVDYEYVEKIFNEIKVKDCITKNVESLTKKLEEIESVISYYNTTEEIEKKLWLEDLEEFRKVAEKYRTMIAPEN
ncbi:DNA topoisomerase 2 [Carp edema virus]|nr:DNA topoisomerase 2 [Carp edema virus]